MTISPQLRALHPQWRILAVFLDVIASGFSTDAACSHPAVKSAFLAESDRTEGWNLTASDRMMRERGWSSAEDIYDEAGIPEKHRRVLDLALWGDDSKPGRHMFTFREIAVLTGHPHRTVERWVSDGKVRIKALVAHDRSD